MQTLPQTIYIDEHLRLEQLADKHALALFTQIDQHREYFSQFMHWPRFTQVLKDTQSFIELCQQEAKQGISYTWAIVYQDVAVGTISFNKGINWQDRIATFGYWLSPDQQGKGIVTRSVEGVIAATSTIFKQYILRCSTINQKSNAVAVRAGFKFDCMLEKEELIGEHYYDVNRYIKSLAA